MHIPKHPPVGSLIAYEYLWQSQSKDREDGAKTYPTAIILARQDIGPAVLAYALGVSHRKPGENERALEVPLKLKRHLGLDDEPAWIYTDQVNIFAWPGPDLREADHLSNLPSAHGTCVIGELPSDWFTKVVEHMAESKRIAKLHPVRRTG